MNGFDYEVIATCQYGVCDHYASGLVDAVDCGEPATHKVWWSKEYDDSMLVCQEHFDFILKTEEDC